MAAALKKAMKPHVPEPGAMSENQIQQPNGLLNPEPA
jgi:hypothetical protein